MTRRERAGGTRHEARHGGGTRRERAGSADPEFVSVNLPSALASRFRVKKEIRSTGAEATVLLVDDLEAGGEERILKLYRPGITLDDDTVEALMTLSQSKEGQPHIVTLHHADVEAGLWFEVQEYCRHRSLHDVMGDPDHDIDLHRLASEVGEALVFLEGRLFLRDLKPENLLVRDLTPLDVVVADFGLTRNAEAGSVRWTEGGTAGYMPPEAGRNRVTKAWDWWSAGVVLAEVALGRHPLVDEDGRLPPSLQILDLINEVPVDVSGIADERIRLLCRGLLVRDPDRRWRAAQVTAWMAGDDPEVPSDEPVGRTAANAPKRQVHFGGQGFDDPAVLAAAFQERWDSALAQLFQDRSPAWIDELEAFLREHDRPAAAAIVAKGTLAATDLPARMAALLVEMDPDLEPVYDGLRLTPAGLADAAHKVIAGRQPGLLAQLEQVRDAGVLSLWSTLPGMRDGKATADGAEETWRRECRRLDDLAVKLRSDGSPVPSAEALDVARARLLLCAVAPSQRRRQHRGVRWRRLLGQERQVPWWRLLADQGRSSTPAAVVAVVLGPDARFAAGKERAQRKTGSSTVSPARERGTLTLQAQGLWLRPQLVVAVPVALLGLLWLTVHFESRLQFFMAFTSAPGERSYYFTPDDLGRLVDAQRWLVGLVVPFTALQLIGMQVRRRRLGPAVARSYVLVSALVQGAVSLAAAALAAAGLLLAYAAFVSEQKGLPMDYVPTACRWLIAAGAVLLGAVHGVLVSLRRLALGLLGGRVIGP